MARVAARRAALAGCTGALALLAVLAAGGGLLLRGRPPGADPEPLAAVPEHDDPVGSAWLIAMIRNNDLDRLASVCAATRHQEQGRSAGRVQLWVAPPAPAAP